MKKLYVAAFVTGVSIACIIPDKGIVVITPCGQQWCAEATDAYAVNAQGQEMVLLTCSWA